MEKVCRNMGKFLLACFLIIAGCFFYPRSAEAAGFSAIQKEYINVLSKLMIEGTVTQNMDIYKEVSKGSSGEICMKAAAISNRAALMAEGIDFLDSNWSQYYAVESQAGSTVFNSTKIISRKSFKKRYNNIIRGLDQVLESVDSSMTQADKALAVYVYLAQNTTYRESKDAHTGYDVLVNHVGVCDGLANVYALAMNTLGIPCVVVSNYSKNHSWNIVKLNGIWYFVDLTNGVGTGKHDGMVISYESFLVGKNTFLKTHQGYQLKDLYGEGNSNDLNMRKIPLATSDYIKDTKEIKNAIEGKTCIFYRQGYWYWISEDNHIKCSTIKGGKKKIFYTPSEGQYIGWLTEYNNKMILSLNSGIYRMDFQKKQPVLLKKVDERENSSEVSEPLWDVIYVGRFMINKNGYLSYYISDFHGARKGYTKIALGKRKRIGSLTKKGRKTVQIPAGQVKQFTIAHMYNRGQRSSGWTSSNPSVADMNSNGYLRAIKSGQTSISTKVNGRKVKFRVKVYGYTISYKNAGVNSTQNKLMVSGKYDVILKDPYRAGYIFQGWYDKTGKNIKIIPKGNTNNIVLYGKWKKVGE